jgi:tetratricopeptide (TPR) repeat protein
MNARWPMTVRFLAFAAALLTIAGCGSKDPGSEPQLTDSQQAGGAPLAAGVRADKLILQAQEQFKSGDAAAAQSSLEAATTLADEVKDAVSRAALLVRIAEAHAGFGNKTAAADVLDRARTSGSKIALPGDKVAHLCQIAAAQVKALKQTGKAAETLKDAKGYVAYIEAPETKTLAMAAIARGYANIEKHADGQRAVAQALEVARTIEDPLGRSQALAVIAGSQAAVQQPDQAVTTFDKAIDAAEKIHDARARVFALVNIAQQLAGAGHNRRANELLDQADDLIATLANNDLKRTAAQHLQAARSRIQ